MLLLNTNTLQLEEFINENVTEYAILSHTWGHDEVNFMDIQSLDTAKQKAGFAKIRGFCEVAASAGYRYGWIDTCCIDKSSTTELSEAINAMFRWYRQSAVCYVYLADVHTDAEAPGFVSSRWFTRGWTLQELLAPKHLIFFDAKWVEIGVKHTLLVQIQEATGIHQNAIEDLNVHNFCVAEKMSWASQRVTTRPEDAVYCLLGLFDVSMPPLFGEGVTKAFYRLQEEIIKNTDDRSIFAWSGFGTQYSGILANSPASFRSCRFTMDQLASRVHSTLPHMLIGGSLLIEVCLWPIAYKTYLVSISPPRECRVSSQRLCFFLRWVGTGQYVRTNHQTAELLDGKDTTLTDLVSLSIRQRQVWRPFVKKQIMIQHHLNAHTLYEIYHASPGRTPNFRFQTLAASGKPSMTLADVDAVGEWDPMERTLKLAQDHFGTAGVFSFSQPGISGLFRADTPRKVILGFDFDFFPVCMIFDANGVNIRQKVVSNHLKQLPSDIAQTRIEDITCLEKNGWSTISEGEIDEVEGRPGAWAVKLTSYEDFQATFANGTWSLEIVSEDGHEWQWRVTIGERIHSKARRTWRTPHFRPGQMEMARFGAHRSSHSNISKSLHSATPAAGEEAKPKPIDAPLHGRLSASWRDVMSWKSRKPI